MIAFGIALYFDLQHPYWTISTVYIVSNPLSGSSAAKATYRLLGTIIGGAVTVLMVPPLVNSPELLSAAIIGWVALCAYAGQLDQSPRGYTFQLAGYTVLLAGLPVVDAPSEVFTMAISRVEEIGLAIICATIINQIVFPGHVGPVLTQKINGWMKSVSDLATDVFLGRMDAKKTQHEWHALTGSIVGMRTLVAEVAYDASHHRELAGLLRGIQDKMRLLPPILSAIEDHVVWQQTSDTPAPSLLEDLLFQCGKWVQSGHGASEEDAHGLLALSEELETMALKTGGQALLTASLAKRIGRFIEVWHECSILHEDLREETISPRSERLIARSQPIKVYRDHGMGLVAALGTVLAIAVPMIFWISTSWTPGMLITQISGVFCCRWIGMDNPTFMLRKTVSALVITAIVAIGLNFTLLPILTDYSTLVAALGLLMIPVGAMKANPAQRIRSALFCIFLPLMLQLHNRLSLDFQSMLTSDVGLILGVACCLVITGLVKTAGAQARARTLLRAGWRVVAAVASTPSAANNRKLQRLLDLVSLWASRQATLPKDSPAMQHDLLRDLRLGNNLGLLQDLAQKAAASARTSVFELGGEITRFYRKGQKDNDRNAVMEKLKSCWNEIAEESDPMLRHRMQTQLVALQICLGRRLPALGTNTATTQALWETANA